MEIDAPEFLQELCAIRSIRPWSHYVRRSPWALRKENFHTAFAGKMGLYCFWWSGPRKKFLNHLARYQYKGERYPGPNVLDLEHDQFPVYVGMTVASATNRMRLRLIQFANLVSQWLVKESRLTEPPATGFRFHSFELFGFRDRVRSSIAARTGKPQISFADAQEYLLAHPAECRDLVAEFQEDFRSLVFDNYSISFVSFADESDLFYAEALSIGLLRPPLNHT